MQIMLFLALYRASYNGVDVVIRKMCSDSSDAAVYAEFYRHNEEVFVVTGEIMEIGVEFLYVVMCEYTNDWIKIKLQECLVYLISILIVSCYIYFTHDFIDIFIQQYITHLVLFMILYTREDFALRSLQ